MAEALNIDAAHNIICAVMKTPIASIAGENMAHFLSELKAAGLHFDDSATVWDFLLFQDSPGKEYEGLQPLIDFAMDKEALPTTKEFIRAAELLGVWVKSMHETTRIMVQAKENPAVAEVYADIFERLSQKTQAAIKALQTKAKTALPETSAPRPDLAQAQEIAQMLLVRPIRSILPPALIIYFCGNHEIAPNATVRDALENYLYCTDITPQVAGLKAIMALADDGKRPAPKDIRNATGALLGYQMQHRSEIITAQKSMAEVKAIPELHPNASSTLLNMHEEQGISAYANKCFNDYVIGELQAIANTLSIQTIGGHRNGIN